MIAHKTVEKNGQLAIQLSEGEYAGIIFSYGKVSFEENDAKDNLKVKFEYDLHDDAGLEIDKPALENYLGDLLIEMVMFGIEQNEIVYTGGVNENREVDPIESDPQ